MSEKEHYISIWFFIGALLAVYGVLIMGVGIYNVFVPPAHPPRLHELHAGVWWGAVLIILGGFYCIRFRPGKEKVADQR